MQMQKKETCEIKVRVNEYLSLDLCIPREMDASEFYALLNLTKDAVKLRIEGNDSPSRAARSMVGVKSPGWADAEDRLMADNWDFSQSAMRNAKRLSKQLPNRKESAIQARYYNERNKYMNKKGRL